MSWVEAGLKKATDRRMHRDAQALRGSALHGCALRGLLLALVCVPLLAACGNSGFRPLYGSAALGGTDAAEKLAHVEIAPIPGRVGQVLRNELIFDTTGGSLAQTPAYRLEIAVRESAASTLVTVNGNSNSSIYSLDASYRLIRIADKKELLRGNSYGRADFDHLSTDIFSNTRARQDAEDRAAKTIGNDLKIRLAAYLSTQS